MKKIIFIFICTLLMLITSQNCYAEEYYEYYTTSYGTIKITGFNETQLKIAKHLIDCDTQFTVPFQGTVDYFDELNIAMNQNPLAPFVKQAWINCDGKTVNYKVDYLIEPYVSKQQNPITYKKALSIANQINNNKLTDYQKYLAINNYLCKSQYYYEAAKHAADTKTKFNKQTLLIQDSYSPYGVLINKTGVCQSYAQAFHLICDLCDLPCLSVTGELAGGRHIWNRIKLNDTWYNIDCSENSCSKLKVTQFAPTSIDKLYKADIKNWCNYKIIPEYTADKYNLEYWNTQNKYINLEDISVYIQKNFIDQRKLPKLIYIRCKSTYNDKSTCTILAKKIANKYSSIGYYPEVVVSTSGHGVYKIQFEY